MNQNNVSLDTYWKRGPKHTGSRERGVGTGGWYVRTGIKNSRKKEQEERQQNYK
jgi:hypothetical protein